MLIHMKKKILGDIRSNFYFFISISGCGQNISQLYENTNEAVVLIKTSKPEIMG